MTFEELSRANTSIKTTDIKGKEYAEVNQRIKVFRMLFPEGCICTNIEELKEGVCVIKATVLDEKQRVLSTGYAYEREGSTFINKTSYIENCETSAVGRALGFLGIGVEASVASAEEVLNAMKQQESMKPISQAHINTLKKALEKREKTVEGLCEYFKVKKLEDFTIPMFEKAMTMLGAK